MADVLTLPGVFRPQDATDTDCTIPLNAALNGGLKDVVIVGRSISGEIHVYGSQADADRVIGLLHRGAAFLTNAQQIDLLKG